MAESIPSSPLDVAILGAGAAGMMAAVAIGQRLAAHPAPPRPFSIALFEKNSRPGIKVLVCGGGRCNFTNAGTTDFLIAQFGRNGRFLSPALHHLDNQGLREFFDRLGVPSHVEHSGKVYPDSNQARSVVDALVSAMRAHHVQIHAGAPHAITSLQRAPAPHAEGAPRFILFTLGGATFTARYVVLAVGGMSYQRMGTVGDGYRFAEALGHSIVTPRPAIVGLITPDAWIKPLQGLAIRDAKITLAVPPELKTKFKTQTSIGDMLFTHFGLSGPAILNPSEIVAEMLEHAPAVTLEVDFVRHLSHEQAHAQLREAQQHQGKRLLRKVLAQSAPEITIESTSPDQTAVTADPGDRQEGPAEVLSVPARLAIALMELAQIPLEQPCATLTSAQIHRLVERLKRCPFAITATRGFKEAMVTAGGVSLKQVEPRTLESRLVPNLFLTGEVLDLTGPSGGYNLQLAFSTGHLAGTTIAERLLTTGV